MLLANGGTWAIESPFPYSKVARGLMGELGIDPANLATKCYRTGVYKGLAHGVFFDQQTFGQDRLVTHSLGEYLAGDDPEQWKAFLDKTPLPLEVQRDIARVSTESVDYFPGLTSEQKKDRLSRIGEKNYLLNVAKIHPKAIPFYQTRTHGCMELASTRLALSIAGRCSNRDSRVCGWIRPASANGLHTHGICVT
jgi:spermidine dehydrogenase